MDTLVLLVLLFLVFIMGMVAAWVVRLMIRQEVDEVVDVKLDERGIVNRRGKP
jgi:Na+-transporting methylmalonyl-CoA/oxaloacetate decarboxylase gamma subunit